MNETSMTSMQRVLTTLGHEEPDRVPFFLLVTMHGAKELGMTIQEYFYSAENVVEGQLRLRARYRHDCICPFFYAAIEVEAWGGEVIFSENGPPNSGRPFIGKSKDIELLEPPKIKKTDCLVKALKAIEMSKRHTKDEVPIIGVVISPFSLPIMQMGFDRYLELMHESPELFNHLMKVNEEFCVDWANAQIASGATVICYFDPVSSTTIIPADMYTKTGFKIAKRTIARIEAPTATHMASGRCLPVIKKIAETGTAALGVSALEDIAELKAACKGKLGLVGNLNGVEMTRWSPEQAEKNVKNAIAGAGSGGGFILSDNHGEIPWQVSDKTLTAISEAVHTWGRYPLEWKERA